MSAESKLLAAIKSEPLSNLLIASSPDQESLSSRLVIQLNKSESPSSSMDSESIDQNNSTYDHSSSPALPKLSMPSLQKSAVVTKSVSIPILSASTIFTTGNANSSRKLFLVMKTAPNPVLIPAQTALPPPPPLKRIPGAGPAPTLLGAAPSGPPLVVALPKLVSDSVSEISVASTSATDNGKEEAPPKRKRRKRTKPSTVRQPTQEEIERVKEFKRLYRGQSPENGSAESIVGLLPATDSEPNIGESLSPDILIIEELQKKKSIRGRPDLSAAKIWSSADRQRSPPSPKHCAIPSQPIRSTWTTVRTQQEIEEHRQKRMRNNEAVRKSRLKARLKVKQSELNCRLLMKQFGELKNRIETLEKDLAWEKRKNEILEEMLRQTQTTVVIEPPVPEDSMSS